MTLPPKKAPRIPTILEAMRDENLFGKSFHNRKGQQDSWKMWRAYLAALFVLPFEDAEAQALYQRHTGRQDVSLAPYRESYIVSGRRSGKSLISRIRCDLLRHVATA